MSEPADLSNVVVGGGLALGVVFGAVANKTNFCTMGALSDIVNMSHWGRMRMWLLAIAVAIVGTTALGTTGLVDLSRAVTQRPVIAWLSLLVGGLTFGVGMTMAGGCANKNLVRIGGGSLRSVVVMVFMGIAGYMTMRGLFAQWRADWLDPVAINLGNAGWTDQSLGTALAHASGLDARTALWAAAGAIALALAAFAFKDRRFRGNLNQWLGGIVIGLLIVGGWYVSGALGYGEHPETMETVFFATNTRALESMSFVGPTAWGLELLLLWTDSSLHLSFGIASLIGVVAGSAAYSLTTGKFRWEGFASLSDLRQQLVGAVLMGFGGVTALGCTVGQGLSGVSTLAIGSFIAVAGIVIGSVAWLKYTLWREESA
jgi:uncharacterized membrane protein YedE/YeeE